MQQQLPQVAHFTRRHPDPRKPSLHQQLQNMRRIALVRLLLPSVAGTHLRRIAHPQLVTQLAQQIRQPVTVAGGFHADQRRRRYLPVELFRLARGLDQLLLPALSRLRVQPTHLLPAGMKITSYNHLIIMCEGSFLPSSFGPHQKHTEFESSLRSYPINPFALFAKGWAELWAIS